MTDERRFIVIKPDDVDVMRLEARRKIRMPRIVKDTHKAWKTPYPRGSK